MARQDPDPRLVLSMMRKIAFFQESDIKQAELSEILVRLRYEHHRAGDIVFSFGKTAALSVQATWATSSSWWSKAA